ncbi:hypothetical protein BH10CHL1_BH10CHL1_26590 [soil metagenome]
MESQKPIIVIDGTGRRGVVESDAMPAMQSSAQVLIRFENMQPLAVPVDMLVLRADGHYDLPLNAAELTAKASQDETNQTFVIPVIEEEVLINKRQVETGKIRVKKVVQEKQETIDVPLLSEEVEIKRVPVNRPVDSPVAVRREGDTLILSLLEEVLVVQKQLLLKEEVHITTKRSERHQTEQVTLRREEVIVEPVDLKTANGQPSA